MDKVTQLNWIIDTRREAGSGTDETVTIRIFRDGQRLEYINLEPGETERLDRGERQTYFWKFQNPSGLGVSVSGLAIPYTEDFPDGIEGHLSVVFEIHGNDLWRVGNIESQVVTGEIEFVADTIDSFRWKESKKAVSFAGTDVLSTDPGEGVRRLTLTY